MNDNNRTYDTILGYSIAFFVFSSSLYIIVEASIGTPAITSSNITEAVRTTTLVVDAILAFILTYIYYNISNIQKKEKDITEEMKKQSKEQTKINKQIAKIEKSRNTPNIKSRAEVIENKIMLRCKNIGTGVATDINVVAEFFVSEEFYAIPAAYDVGVQVQKIENLNIKEKTNRGQETVVYDVSYSSLESNRVTKKGTEYSLQSEERLKSDESCTFDVEQRVKRYRDHTGGPPEPISIEKMISDFKNNFNEFTICCKLYIEYKNSIGEKKVQKVDEGWKKIGEENNIAGIFTNGRIIANIENPLTNQSTYQAIYRPVE